MTSSSTPDQNVAVSGYPDWQEMASSNPDVRRILEESVRSGSICSIDLSKNEPENAPSAPSVSAPRKPKV